MFGTSEQIVLPKMVKIHYLFWMCQLGQFRGKKQREEERLGREKGFNP